MVQDAETEEAYVVDAKSVRPLQAADRTLLRRALIDPEGVTAAKLTHRGKTWEAELEHPDDPSLRRWSPPDVGFVVEMALSLRAKSFDRKRRTTGLESVARIELQVEAGGEPQTLEIFAEGEGAEARYHATWPGGEGLAALQTSLTAEVVAKLDALSSAP